MPAAIQRTAWVVWATALLAYIVAVFDRTSLGVVAPIATERFGIGAGQFSMFVVVQLLVYAAMQVPTGLLLDRFGPRLVIAAGGLILAAGQALLSQVTTVELAVLARVLVGVGDAMTFISAIRLIPSWFPPQRAPVLTQLTGQVGQLGQVLSAVPLTALLAARGWQTAYALAAAVGVLVSVLVLLVVRDRPPGAPNPPRARGFAEVGHDLAEAFRHPGTRLGLWAHFTAQFSGMVFALMWGYPFMVMGLGLSPVMAGGLLTFFVVGSVISGPVLGRLTASYPMRRSNLVMLVIAATIFVWTVVLAWPGPAPLWLVVLLVAVLAVNGPTSMVGFDFARSFNPAERLGSATGIVNMGGFVASLITISLIGFVLDAVGQAPDYTLADFKLAFCTQYLVWAFGLAAIVRTRILTRRRHGAPADHFYEALIRHAKHWRH
ncbi:MAG: MFS transporter [Actinomycetales bacterium]